MRHGLTLTVLALFAGFGFAADKYVLTGENTKVEFVGTKPNGKHTGGFKTITGTATVDGDLSTLKIEVEIDVDSMYSDDPKLTGHLKSPDFFAVKAHPKSTFKTTKIEKTEGGAKITGDLTLLGKTKSISFPAKIESKDGVMTLNAEFKIDRTDFGMNYGQGKVDNEVGLKVTVSAKK